MSDLMEEVEGENVPEFSVTELSGAVKRMIEGEFFHIRVRGELGRISRPASGHIYLTLKDDRSNLDAVIWKGTAARLTHRPEEGMEVVATGRMTIFAGQSKYQLVIEDMRPAGAGALMAMLEQRRMKLAAEGLFDAARKQELPFLPEVIGVVTSPSGAVIRDILHRLRDRFPRQVLIWPVAVQGEKCASEVAAGIRGFNALTAGGGIPRPDLIIVARGGGSLEDLWGFNEEIVVRAAAESMIPLISAVGHETDTTLIDFAADYRAPTPTAAAERAVPVRMDILTWVQDCGARLSRGAQAGVTQRRVRLGDLARALPRPASLLETAQQRLDRVADRLEPALVQSVQTRSHRVQTVGARLVPALDRALAQKRLPYARAGANLRPSVLSRAIADAQQKLNALERMRQSLGYMATLKRGYAVLRSETGLITTTAALRTASEVEVELADGKAQVKPFL
ncbi:MAG: exodeoxyribonuclease VII large subunit [Proteobacteria bacterium]|nr:exodeoxyribonuclease VII large subunit [Pseudomonadota bacterium]